MTVQIPDVTIPPPPLQLARRIFVWTVGIALLALWATAIAFKQDQWAIASIMGLLIFAYVMAGSAEMITQILSNAGVLKAVTAASAAVTSAANVANAGIAQIGDAIGGAAVTTTTTTVAPAPTPTAGPRDDLAQ